MKKSFPGGRSSATATKSVCQAKALNKEVRYYWESKMCYPKEEITNSTINTASSKWHILKIEVTDSPDDFYYVWGMNKWSLTSRCWPILCMSPAHTFWQPLLKSQHTWCKHLKPTRIKSADLMAGHEPLIAEGGHILFNQRLRVVLKFLASSRSSTKTFLTLLYKIKAATNV